MRIYLSSTSVDLKPFRQAVLGALRRMGHEAAAMEDYGAEDQWPADKCVADVQASQLYVGVFAWRYGFVPAGRQFSVTEMEYLAAREKGIPTLIFVLDPEMAWPPKFIDRGEGAHRIEELRDRLMKTHLVSLFASPEDLAAKVATAVARVDSANGKKGASDPAVPWTIAELRERARIASEDYFEKMQRQKVFLPQVYVPRSEVEAHLDSFADPHCHKTGLILVGGSGSGKTNTLCHWVRHYQESAHRPKDVLLFVGGNTLPGGQFDLRQAILDRFDVSGTMHDFLAAFGKQRGDSDTQLLIVIDSVDKHSQPAELMRQIDDMIVLEEVVPWYKVLVSIAEIPYASLRNDGFVPNPRDYYAEPDKEDCESCKVRLGLLSPEELSAAYASYMKEPGFAPASGFGELTDEVKVSLRKPLVLRIVMELFHDRKVPDRVLGTEVLFEYCSKKIFRHIDRTFFVNRLVDFLYDRRQSSASFDELAREADLRHALLNHTPGSCYPQLLDEQVLEEHTKRVSAILPPQRSLAFTYDRLFEYLLLTRLVERFGMRPEALVKLTREAPGYLPLHGVLTTLLINKLEEGRPEEAAAVLKDGEPAVTRALARRVFAELENLRPLEEGQGADALSRLVEAMVKAPTPFVVDLLLEAAAELQDLGSLRRAASIHQALAPALPAELDPRLRASFHRGVGMVKSMLGNQEEALADLQASLPLYRKAGDKAGEQAVLDDIAEVQLEVGKVEEAHESLLASHKIDRELVAQTGSAEAKEGEAHSLHGLSAFYVMTGRPDLARESAESSLRIRRELGNRRAVADSVLQAARSQRRLLLFEDALSSAGEALSIYREVGSKLGIASALFEIGGAEAELGRAADAAAHLKQALALFKAIGNAERQGDVWRALGALASEAGDHDAAMRELVGALELYRSVGEQGASAACLIEIGAGHLAAGRPDQALERLSEAGALFTDVLRKPWDARCPAYLAEASAALGRRDAAAAFAEQAASALGVRPYWEEDRQAVHYSRYRALKAAGRDADAREALRQARESVELRSNDIRSDAARKAYLECSRLRRAILEARESPQAAAQPVAS